MKLAPSKNPEKESKQFSSLALICGILSLILWFFAIGGLTFGVRGLILSKRVEYQKGIIFSVIGIALGAIAFGWYFIQKS